ncbi:hypothetical protein FOV72_19810 [Gordonia rubripertincta]|uniref:hypothetical protein n=1 Tax=Gordonia rubripertincta TaxID=36822 RepID=UPI00117F7A37|nr:hypothetical protein [Gordonia rubripertincta]TSD93509.1 hypothetical protein FOV72_19810 [Gordonia rubripertincta]
MGREMVIISGIAVPNWKVDHEDVHQEDCVLKLRERVDHLEQWTAHVGLASVSNDDTEWVFAIDRADVAVDDAGELVLTTHLALQGEWSALYRFGYQIVCTARRVVTSISGTITWPTQLYMPSSPSPAGVSGLFTIAANERKIIAGNDPGQFGGGEQEVLTPVTPGEIVDVTVGLNECSARYRIVEPPKGKKLKVVVNQHQMRAKGTAQTINVGPTKPGGDLVQLTPLEPVRENVDFKISVGGGVR